ncbi:MAG: hypothetical protein J2P18_00145 [Nocardia sp.]|nr:hypothetical protein [Nocardia sp.]
MATSNPWIAVGGFAAGAFLGEAACVGLGERENRALPTGMYNEIRVIAGMGNFGFKAIGGLVGGALLAHASMAPAGVPIAAASLAVAGGSVIHQLWSRRRSRAQLAERSELPEQSDPDSEAESESNSAPAPEPELEPSGDIEALSKADEPAHVPAEHVAEPEDPVPDVPRPPPPGPVLSHVETESRDAPDTLPDNKSNLLQEGEPSGDEPQDPMSDHPEPDTAPRPDTPGGAGAGRRDYAAQEPEYGRRTDRPAIFGFDADELDRLVRGARRGRGRDRGILFDRVGTHIYWTLWDSVSDIELVSWLTRLVLRRLRTRLVQSPPFGEESPGSLFTQWVTQARREVFARHAGDIEMMQWVRLMAREYPSFARRLRGLSPERLIEELDSLSESDREMLERMVYESDSTDAEKQRLERILASLIVPGSPMHCHSQLRSLVYGEGPSVSPDDLRTILTGTRLSAGVVESIVDHYAALGGSNRKQRAYISRVISGDPRVHETIARWLESYRVLVRRSTKKSFRGSVRETNYSKIESGAMTPSLEDLRRIRDSAEIPDSTFGTAVWKFVVHPAQLKVNPQISIRFWRYAYARVGSSQERQAVHEILEQYRRWIDIAGSPVVVEQVARNRRHGNIQLADMALGEQPLVVVASYFGRSKKQVDSLRQVIKFIPNTKKSLAELFDARSRRAVDNMRGRSLSWIQQHRTSELDEAVREVWRRGATDGLFAVYRPVVETELIELEMDDSRVGALAERALRRARDGLRSAATITEGEFVETFERCLVAALSDVVVEYRSEAEKTWLIIRAAAAHPEIARKIADQTPEQILSRFDRLSRPERDALSSYEDEKVTAFAETQVRVRALGLLAESSAKDIAFVQLGLLARGLREPMGSEELGNALAAVDLPDDYIGPIVRNYSEFPEAGDKLEYIARVLAADPADYTTVGQWLRAYRILAARETGKNFGGPLPAPRIERWEAGQGMPTLASLRIIRDENGIPESIFDKAVNAYLIRPGQLNVASDHTDVFWKFVHTLAGTVDETEARKEIFRIYADEVRAARTKTKAGLAAGMSRIPERRGEEGLFALAMGDRPVTTIATELDLSLDGARYLYHAICYGAGLLDSPDPSRHIDDRPGGEDTTGPDRTVSATPTGSASHAPEVLPDNEINGLSASKLERPGNDAQDLMSDHSDSELGPRPDGPPAAGAGRRRMTPWSSDAAGISRAVPRFLNQSSLPHRRFGLPWARGRRRPPEIPPELRGRDIPWTPAPYLPDDLTGDIDHMVAAATREWRWRDYYRGWVDRQTLARAAVVAATAVAYPDIPPDKPAVLRLWVDPDPAVRELHLVVVGADFESVAEVTISDDTVKVEARIAADRKANQPKAQEYLTNALTQLTSVVSAAARGVGTTNRDTSDAVERLAQAIIESGTDPPGVDPKTGRKQTGVHQKVIATLDGVGDDSCMLRVNIAEQPDGPSLSMLHEGPLDQALTTGEIGALERIYGGDRSRIWAHWARDAGNPRQPFLSVRARGARRVSVSRRPVADGASSGGSFAAATVSAAESLWKDLVPWAGERDLDDLRTSALVLAQRTGPAADAVVTMTTRHDSAQRSSHVAVTITMVSRVGSDVQVHSESVRLRRGDVQKIAVHFAADDDPHRTADRLWRTAFGTAVLDGDAVERRQIVSAVEQLTPKYGSGSIELSAPGVAAPRIVNGRRRPTQFFLTVSGENGQAIQLAFNVPSTSDHGEMIGSARLLESDHDAAGISAAARVVAGDLVPDPTGLVGVLLASRSPARPANTIEWRIDLAEHRETHGYSEDYEFAVRLPGSTQLRVTVPIGPPIVGRPVNSCQAHWDIGADRARTLHQIREFLAYAIPGDPDLATSAMAAIAQSWVDYGDRNSPVGLAKLRVAYERVGTVIRVELPVGTDNSTRIGPSTVTVAVQRPVDGRVAEQQVHAFRVGNHWRLLRLFGDRSGWQVADDDLGQTRDLVRKFSGWSDTTPDELVDRIARELNAEHRLVSTDIVIGSATAQLSGSRSDESVESDPSARGGRHDDEPTTEDSTGRDAATGPSGAGKRRGNPNAAGSGRRGDPWAEHVERAVSGLGDRPLTVDELSSYAAQLAEDNPGVCELVQVGTARDGRTPLQMLVVGADREDAPTTLAYGGVHPNEPWASGTVQALMDFAVSDPVARQRRWCILLSLEPVAMKRAEGWADCVPLRTEDAIRTIYRGHRDEQAEFGFDGTPIYPEIVALLDIIEKYKPNRIHPLHNTAVEYPCVGVTSDDIPDIVDVVTGAVAKSPHPPADRIGEFSEFGPRLGDGVFLFDAQWPWRLIADHARRTGAPDATLVLIEGLMWHATIDPQHTFAQSIAIAAPILDALTDLAAKLPTLPDSDMSRAAEHALDIAKRIAAAWRDTPDLAAPTVNGEYAYLMPLRAAGMMWRLSNELIDAGQGTPDILQAQAGLDRLITEQSAAFDAAFGIQPANLAETVAFQLETIIGTSLRPEDARIDDDAAEADSALEQSPGADTFDDLTGESSSTTVPFDISGDTWHDHPEDLASDEDERRALQTLLAGVVGVDLADTAVRLTLRLAAALSNDSASTPSVRVTVGDDAGTDLPEVTVAVSGLPRAGVPDVNFIVDCATRALQASGFLWGAAPVGSAGEISVWFRVAVSETATTRSPPPPDLGEQRESVTHLPALDRLIAEGVAITDHRWPGDDVWARMDDWLRRRLTPIESRSFDRFRVRLTDVEFLRGGLRYDPNEGVYIAAEVVDPAGTVVGGLTRFAFVDSVGRIRVWEFDTGAAASAEFQRDFEPVMRRWYSRSGVASVFVAADPEDPDESVAAATLVRAGFELNMDPRYLAESLWGFDQAVDRLNRLLYLSDREQTWLADLRARFAGPVQQFPRLREILEYTSGDLRFGEYLMSQWIVFHGELVLGSGREPVQAEGPGVGAYPESLWVGRYAADEPVTHTSVVRHFEQSASVLVVANSNDGIEDADGWSITRVHDRVESALLADRDPVAAIENALAEFRSNLTDPTGWNLCVAVVTPVQIVYTTAGRGALFSAGGGEGAKILSGPEQVPLHDARVRRLFNFGATVGAESRGRRMVVACTDGSAQSAAGIDAAADVAADLRDLAQMAVEQIQNTPEGQRVAPGVAVALAQPHAAPPRPAHTPRHLLWAEAASDDPETLTELIETAGRVWGIGLERARVDAMAFALRQVVTVLFRHRVQHVTVNPSLIDEPGRGRRGQAILHYEGWSKQAAIAPTVSAALRGQHASEPLFDDMEEDQVRLTISFDGSGAIDAPPFVPDFDERDGGAAGPTAAGAGRRQWKTPWSSETTAAESSGPQTSEVVDSAPPSLGKRNDGGGGARDAGGRDGQGNNVDAGQRGDSLDRSIDSGTAPKPLTGSNSGFGAGITLGGKFGEFPPPEDFRVDLGNGRWLQCREHGPKTGRVVIQAHGRPGSHTETADSRLLWELGDDDDPRKGIRLITWSRPGYGGTPIWQARTADGAEWIKAILRNREVSEAAGVGRSGGGQYLAAAMADPDSPITKGALLVAGPGPELRGRLRGVVKNEFLHGSHRSNLPSVVKAYRDDPDNFNIIHGGIEYSQNDLEILAENHEMLRETFVSATQPRSDGHDSAIGWILDGRRSGSRWGFNVGDIHRPTLLWNTVGDKFNPDNIANLWHREIVNAPCWSYVVTDGAGHFDAMQIKPAVYAWLTDRQHLLRFDIPETPPNSHIETTTAEWSSLRLPMFD